jgi:hypothetical protein
MSRSISVATNLGYDNSFLLLLFLIITENAKTLFVILENEMSQ